MNLTEKGYQLVFEENFADGLDKNKWTAVEETVKAHSAKVNTEVEPTHVDTRVKLKHAGCEMNYRKENISCRNNTLVITGNRDGEGFEGGKVVCNGFVYKFGYLEVTAELPAFKKGVWPMFSVLSTKGSMYDAQYDVIAAHGDKKRNACNLVMSWIDDIYEKPHTLNLLYSSDGSTPRFYPSPESGEELAPGEHVFGFEWTPEYAKFYCDGNEYVRVYLDVSCYAPFSKGCMSKLTASISIGLPNIDPPDKDTELPTEFIIKNIKLYQNEGCIFVKR